MTVHAVLWDFGGVILESPFDAFAAYERANGLPVGLVRRLNSTNPDGNAWARLERAEVDVEGFRTLFEAEAAAVGHRIDAGAVLAGLSGRVRPAMVEALRRCSERLPTGCITNNFVGFGEDRGEEVGAIFELFHVVIESSKVGLRKPDPRIYKLACDALGVAPEETAFLDDLGINLKPARALGMTTIKVGDPTVALAELQAAVGFDLS